MNFKGHKDINQSIEKVAAFFADPKYLGEYQDGFLRKELVSGTAGQVGAVSKMYYKMGRSEMELTETITTNNLPHSFEGFYHHKHMDNTMKVSFTELDEHTTRYHYDIEYLRINWVIPKLMAILFPGMYRKQGEKWMVQFKEFVDRQ